MVSRSNSSINEPLVPYRDRNSNTYSEAGSDTPLVPLGGMDSRRGSTTSGDLWALMSNGRQVRASFSRAAGPLLVGRPASAQATARPLSFAAH